MRAVLTAWRSVKLDQEFLAGYHAQFRVRSTLRALLTIPSLRATFLMRLASNGGLLSYLARGRLLSGYGCDVSAGATLKGALHLPHPIGIVIGNGAVIETGVTIYQHVTVGAHGGAYPVVCSGAILYPASIIVGAVSIGRNARVGAGVFCDSSVPSGATQRHSTRASG